MKLVMKRSCWCLLAILSVIELATADDPINVEVGSEAVLPCDLKHFNTKPSPFVIEWSRPENPLPIYYKIARYPARISAQFKGRTSLLRNSASLRIHNIRLSDEGWYECRILFLNSDAPASDDVERNGTWVKLVVTARPTMLSAPPLIFVGKENGSLVLRCKITGKPTPQIAWWKDEWPLKNGENGYVINGGELVVTSLQKKHRGSYECKGWNSNGQVEYTTRVYVKAPPELSMKPQNMTLKENLDAYFSCKATGYPDNITYSWYYEGKAIESVTSLIRRHSVATDGTLVIFNIQRDDSGHVSCRASNGYGNPVSASAYLTVQYQAQVREMPATVYGGLTLTVTLPCKSEGEPPVNTVTWRKDGKILITDTHKRISKTSRGNLQIHNLLPSDSGKYTCTPYNILGSGGESSPVQLIPKEPPNFTIRPQTPQESEIGKPLRLFCHGTGDPLPTLSWRKVGVAMNLPNQRIYWNGGNLTITSVKKEDHGSWECVLTSPVVQLISNVKVNVKYTTPHDIRNLTVLTSSDSASVFWLPGYDGGYPQHFMIWFKRVDQGDHAWLTRSVNRSRTSAIVNRLEPETVYQFAVLAENVLGSGKFSRTVTARTKALPTKAPMRDFNSVPPPRELTYLINSLGLVTLYWKQPKLIKAESLLGFLVEYRLISIDHDVHVTSTSENSIQLNSQTRERRWIYGNRGNQKQSIKSGTSEEKRSLPRLSKVEEIIGNNWEMLSAYPANVSRAEINAEKLYRDRTYEVHVLAVTSLAFSAPSESVYVNTTGLVAYPPSPSPASTSTAILSGVVAGVLFMCLIVALGIGYCFYQCKSRKEKEIATIGEGKNFLNNLEEGGDVTKKVLVAQISSSSSGGPTDVMSKTESDIVIQTSKFGIFQKLKKQLCGKNNCKNKPEPSRERNSFQLLTEGSEKSSKDSCSSLDSKKEKTHFDFFKVPGENLTQPDNYKFQAAHILRPNSNVIVESNSVDHGTPSDSVADHNDLVVRAMGASTEENPKNLEEGPSLEIDCSQSDVEVRFIPARPKQRFSSSQFSFVSQAKRSFPPPKNPPLLRNVVDCPVASGISVHQKSFSHFMPDSEFIYLTGFRKTLPVIARAESRGSRCLTPICLSTPDANPYHFSSNNYHHHTLASGGHFPLGPWASVSALPQSADASSRSARGNAPSSFGSYPHNETIRKSSNRSPQPNSLFCRNKDQSQRYIEHNVSTNRINPMLKLDSPHEATVTLNHCAKNKSDSTSPISRTFRSNSCSLPPQTQRKYKRHEKRFSSVDDMLLNNEEEEEEEEDQKHSFTSGSASTVRFNRSIGSNCSISDDKNESTTTLRLCHETKEPNENPATKPRDFISPVLPASDVGAGSCSGYESQNTSSEASSNNRDPRKNAPKLCLKQPHSRNSDLDRNGISRKTDQIRNSAPSSEESRTRKDNSLVDEKYEWDTEMESEILKALKNFNYYNRDEFISSDNLEENDRLLSPDNESSYSKEKMEKRCAVLKEEYLQHKRRLSSRNLLFSLPDT